MKKFRYKVGLFAVLFVMTCLFGTIDVKAVQSSVTGIDVSKYNGTVDWNSVRNQGVTFAMIRTGEGQEPANYADDVDPQFEANYAGAAAVGIAKGAYHVCCTKTVEGAVNEAKYCLKILNGRPLDYPIAYDIEKTGTFSTGKDNVTAIADAFCKEIAAAGYTPMIYSTSSYFNDYFDMTRLSGYKIWVAQYGVEQPNVTFKYDLWQYTNSLSVQGANTNNGLGACDVNYSFMKAESVSLDVTSVKLGAKETFQLNASMLPLQTTDKVTWSSSNSSVAGVDQTGKVTAKKPGTAYVTAQTGSGQQAQCKVVVKKAPKKVAFSKTKMKLKKGKSAQLKVKFSTSSFSNQLTYTSSKSSVIKVDSTGKITAKKKGTATVTIKTFNGKKGKIKITVK